MTTQLPPVAFSGNIPTNYDTHLGPIFFEPFAADIAERVSQLKPQRMLELACGTGRLTRQLAKILPPGGHLVATDINPAMLAFASGQLFDTPAITWDMVDAEDLPYPGYSFDVVVSQFGAMFYKDKIKAYAEARRTLNPGGIFFMLTWDRLENNPVALTAHQTLAHFFPINTPGFFNVPFSYHNEQQIRNEIALAGFGAIHSVLVTLKGRSTTALSVAMGLLKGSPAYTEIVERDPELLEPMLEELSARLAAQFGASNLEVPIQARLFVAEKS
jgi:SAM-dependent methyltransferase